MCAVQWLLCIYIEQWHQGELIVPVNQLALDVIVKLLEWQRWSFTARLECLTACKMWIVMSCRVTTAVVIGRGYLSRV